VKNINRILAKTIFRIVRKELSTEQCLEIRRPSVRLKDLRYGEVIAFLEEWENRKAASGLSDVQVVIARGGEASYPKMFLAKKDCSVTYYRNNNANGLIYIQTKTESDEQGLQSMFTVRDRNFLDGTFDDENFDVKQELVKASWECSAEADIKIPDELKKMLIFVLDALHPDPFSVPVRSYCGFLDYVIKQIIAPPYKALDFNELAEIIGKSLCKLGLFPDVFWEKNRSFHAIKRRLATNFYYSEMLNPSGNEINQNDLNDTIEKKNDFRNYNEELFEPQEQEYWRELCLKFCQDHNIIDVREKIPFYIYEQLFKKKASGRPLGERVETEIGNYSHDRLYEFNLLDVKEGLSRNVAEDAQKFLEAEPTDPNENNLLRDILSKTTLRMVKRIAFPAAKPFSNPLIQLIEIIREFYTIINDDHSNYVLKMELGKGPNDISASIGLFTFLFGKTLRTLVEINRDDVTGLQIEISKELLEIQHLDTIRNMKEDDYESEAIEKTQWNPLPIDFSLIKNDKEIINTVNNCVWKPENIEYLSLLWVIIASPEFTDNRNDLIEHFWEIPIDQTLDEWVEAVSSRLSPTHNIRLKSFSQEAMKSNIIIEMIENKKQFFSNVCNYGLSIEAISEYAEKWESLLYDAKRDYIPKGIIEKRLETFLSYDTIYDRNQNKLLLLATHPFRLKWFAEYLNEILNVLIKVISCELVLNKENEDFYLSHLKNLSPHKYPPVISNNRRETLIATKETGLHEHFSPIKSENRTSSRWTETVDKASVEEIANLIKTYLESHPHKKDGLALLTVLPSGGSFPLNLVSAVRKGEWKDLSINFHVIAPRHTWPNIISDFEKIESGNRMTMPDRIFPPLQLKMYDLHESLENSVALEKITCDLAIVPNFFGNSTEITERTIEETSRSGSYNLLWDRTTHIEKGSSGGTVSIALRPYEADNTLDCWSSINVRMMRCKLIAADNPEITEFFEIAVIFENAVDLFNILHKRSHWVITLDQFIGREQIESLPEKPDVLTIKEGIGGNGLYTLIVSSNVGRKYIQDRLDRKIKNIDSDAIAECNTKALSEKIYNEIRNIAPSLVLRAMGLSRITEEILGLMIAKNIASRFFPENFRDGITAWLSLDDYPEWFESGDSATRADLCRITFFREKKRLKVDILVVEGKLRQIFDSHGVRQVSRTMRLFEEIFNPIENDKLAHDSKLWRKTIISAIENTSSNARKIIGLKDFNNDIFRIPDDIRNDFRAGEFEVHSINGIYSICLYNKKGKVSQEQKNCVNVFTSYGNEVLELIEQKKRILVDEQNEIFHESEYLKKSKKDKEVLINNDMEKGNEVFNDKPNGLPKIVLENKYQTVLDTFSEFNIKVNKPVDSIENYVEGPASILFRVTPDTGIKPDHLSTCKDALKLKLSLPEEADIRFSIGDGTVNIDIPKDEKERYFIDAMSMWEKWKGFYSDQLSVPLGEDRYGKIVAINFSSSNSPHLLIGGTTGSGKSEALNTILQGMIRYYSETSLRLHLVDPKGTELLEFENCPHLVGDIGWDSDDAILILQNAVDEMQKRYRAFKNSKTRTLKDFNSKVNKGLPWWVIVLDEYADLTSELEEKKKIEMSLKRLAQKGRACGIHVIIATQKPSAEVISTNLRSNLPAQIALRVKSSIESGVIISMKGAETLNGKGDAFFHAEGKLTRVQCAIVR